MAKRKRCWVCGDPGSEVRFWARWKEWAVTLCRGHRERIWLWHYLHRQLGTFEKRG